MKISKTTQVLCGALFLGVACASAVWLFVVPRDRGITDEHARRIGYANATQRTAANALYARVRNNKRLDSRDVSELTQLLNSGNPGARVNALVTVGVVAEVTRDAEENRKALDLLLSVARHPDPEMRLSVIHDLLKFRDPRSLAAIEAMTQDQDSRVRQEASSRLAQIKDAYQKRRPSW